MTEKELEDAVALFEGWIKQFRPDVQAVVGYGKDEMFVYVQKGDETSIPTEFSGVPVVVTKTGPILPAGATE